MHTNDKRFPFLVGLAVAGLGFLGGWCFWGGESATPGSRAGMRGTLRPTGVATDPLLRDLGEAPLPGTRLPATGRPATRQVVTEAVNPGRSGERVEAPPEGEMFTEKLLAHFVTEFHLGWAEQRPEPPPDQRVATASSEFQVRMLELPRRMGARAASEANGADALDRALEAGEAGVVLAALGRDRALFKEDDLTDEFLERVLRPRSSGRTVAGSALVADADATLADGMTIEFGPGVHRLDERRLRGADGRSIPEDLTIVGAGMNRTLLTLGDLAARGETRRLSFKNLTVDCGNDYFFDLRDGALTLDLEFVRIVRFDMGAGGSLIFGTRKGCIVRAVGCEFVGGYGRLPSSGTLFRGRAFIASFENCRFARLDLRLGVECRVVFRQCAFDQFFEDPTASPHATFTDSLVRPLISGEEYYDRKVRSLTDFFPGWTGF